MKNEVLRSAQWECFFFHILVVDSPLLIRWPSVHSITYLEEIDLPLPLVKVFLVWYWQKPYRVFSARHVSINSASRQWRPLTSNMHEVVHGSIMARQRSILQFTISFILYNFSFSQFMHCEMTFFSNWFISHQFPTHFTCQNNRSVVDLANIVVTDEGTPTLYHTKRALVAITRRSSVVYFTMKFSLCHFFLRENSLSLIINHF